MKLTLCFLSALLAISQQQFHHPMELNWFSPQNIPYNYLPIYYNNPQDNIPFNRYFRPSRPMPYYQNDEMQDVMTDSKIVENDNNLYTDAESRVKTVKKPALNDKQDPRFFYFGSASTYTNPFFKTATFTLTSTVNITRVQICVNSAAFAAGATTCRRKRHDINLGLTDEPDYEQFYIAPTETQKVESTLLPETDSIQKESRYITNIQDGLVSSQHENNLKELGSGKQKRFVFNQYVASTTLTTYSFLTTTVTKTAKLADDGNALCRPEGYINC